MSENALITGSVSDKGLPVGNPGPHIEPEHSGETVAGTPPDLRSLVNHNMSLPAETSLEEAQKFFGAHELEFIAVVENGHAIGLCARRQIGIVLGSRYGFSLFSRNPVRDYLVPQSLLIRTTDSIHAVLKRLSARRDEFFYDDVMIEDEDGHFVGSIFVRNLVRLQHGLLLDNIGQLERNRAELERKNTQMEQELIMAGKVQQAMLSQVCPTFPPQSPPESSLLQFHHRYLPAGRVSGDFFYVSRICDHIAGVFICDVMGHGVRSAMITSMLRALVEEVQCDVNEQPGELLARLNDDLFAILRQNDETMYATAIYMVIDTDSLQVRWASAGHPSPLLLRGRDTVELLPVPREKRGKVLGLVAASRYETSETVLQPGDKLLLYTDGIYEIFEGEKEFGMNGLVAALHENLVQPVPRLLDNVLKSAREFSLFKDFEDDVCLLAIEIARGNKG